VYYGVPVNVAQKLLEHRKRATEIMFHGSNLDGGRSVARLLGMPYLGLHTPADLLGERTVEAKVAEVYAANDNPTVQEILDNLVTIREYAEAPEGQRPAIWVGGKNSYAGKTVVDFAGGLGAELDELKAREARSQLEGLFENAKEVQGVKLFTLYLTGTPTETVRTMCDAARDRAACSVTAIVAENEGKYSLAVAVGKEAQAKGLAAGRLAKEIASVAGGNGGGKPDFAMAGIRDASKIDDALNAVPGIVEKALNT